MSLEKPWAAFSVCTTPQATNPFQQPAPHWRSIAKEPKPQTLMCLRKGLRRWRALPMWMRSTWKSLIIALLSWIKGTIEQKNEKAVPRGRENLEERSRVSLVKPFQSRSWRTGRNAQLLYICWEHCHWTAPAEVFSACSDEVFVCSGMDAILFVISKTENYFLMPLQELI